MSQSVLAKVGINALVDEATGYQEVRDPDALREMLKAYVAEDFLVWQSGFPQKYYQELCRLHGCEFDPESMGEQENLNAFTQRYVYGFLISAGADESVDTETVRQQLLADENGDSILVSHVIKLVTVMTLSQNLGDFEKKFHRVFKIAKETDAVSVQ